MSKSITTIERTASKAIKPKPRKTEIIEALVQLRIEENAKINEAERLAFDKARIALEQKVKEYIVANIADLLVLNTWGNRVVPTIDFNDRKLPADLLAEFEAMQKMSNGNRLMTHYGSIKEQIKREFEGVQSKSERVKAMLDDTETRKVLLEMLAIAEPKQAKLAA